MILPERQDRGVVVFLVLPSLAYERRMVLSFGAIAVGFALQFLTGGLLPGVLLLAAGNLLLLVKGYDNRVDFGAFEPDTHWERVERARLIQIRALDAKIRKWDLTAIDASNPLGFIVFLLVVGVLALPAVTGTGRVRMLAIDALVLLVPHWLTGIRSALRTPGLLIRIDTIEAVLSDAARRLQRHRVTLLMLLKGREAKLPEDVKFKVDIEGQHPDFLGLYGQVVLNEVQGTSYPYFYVVLVAREGFGLEDAFQRFRPEDNVTKEFKREGKVEVMVIRQHTTKKSGYHTKAEMSSRLFSVGLGVAEQVAAKAAA